MAGGAFLPTGGVDIYFNAAESGWDWAAPRVGAPPPKYIDLESVALHEIGHAIGLDHPYLGRGKTCVEPPVMCHHAKVDGERYVPQRTLDKQDIDAFLRLYGVSQLAAPVSPSTSPTARPTTPTPTTIAPGCPSNDRSLCEFAAEVERRLRAGRLAALEDLLVPSTYTCPLLYSSPALCVGKSRGEQVQAYRVDYFESGPITIDEARTRLRMQPPAAEGTDDYGGAKPRLYGLTPDGQMIFSEITLLKPDRGQRDDPGMLFRAIYSIEPVRQDGTWRIRAVGLDAAYPGYGLGQVLSHIPGMRVWNAAEGLTRVPANGFSFGGGATVNIPGDCLNLRSGPSTGAKVLTCIRHGVRLGIDGGPVDADGVHWWRVSQQLESGWNLGWASAAFLVPCNGFPACNP